MSRCTAAVSSVVPFPVAPKLLTLRVEAADDAAGLSQSSTGTAASPAPATTRARRVSRWMATGFASIVATDRSEAVCGRSSMADLDSEAHTGVRGFGSG